MPEKHNHKTNHLNSRYSKKLGALAEHLTLNLNLKIVAYVSYTKRSPSLLPFAFAEWPQSVKPRLTCVVSRIWVDRCLNNDASIGLCMLDNAATAIAIEPVCGRRIEVSRCYAWRL